MKQQQKNKITVESKIILGKKKPKILENRLGQVALCVSCKRYAYDDNGEKIWIKPSENIKKFYESNDKELETYCFECRENILTEQRAKTTNKKANYIQK